jgi:hypothetical protein
MCTPEKECPEELALALNALQALIDPFNYKLNYKLYSKGREEVD